MRIVVLVILRFSLYLRGRLCVELAFWYVCIAFSILIA